MKIVTIAALAALTCLGSANAQAAGCIKGALIGGAAGHYLANNHGIIGAVAGCVGGRYLANRDRRQQQQYAPQGGSYQGGGYDRGGGYGGRGY